MIPGSDAICFNTGPAGVGSCSRCTLGWDIQIVKQKRSLCDGMTLHRMHTYCPAQQYRVQARYPKVRACDDSFGQSSYHA